MRIPYFKCKKCGKEVHVSKRVNHLIREHGFKDGDFPWTRLKAWRQGDYSALEKEKKLLSEWFEFSKVKTWVSPRRAAREL